MKERRPFAVTGASPHYAPDRPVKLDHIALDLSVDPKKKKLEGTITHRAKVVASHLKWIKLDQVDLDILDVKIGMEKAKFFVEGNFLHIELNRTFEPGSTIEFSVKYQLKNPRRGIYFVGPDSDYPSKLYQAWTQGQDEDSRFWFPTFDYPNQKATTEVSVRVPKGFTAISNGALISKTDQADGVQFHYRLGTPHVTYLVSLVVGEFSEWADTGPHGLKVQYYVPKGREADGKRSFENTAKMVTAFEEKTGVRYPYEKYSQVAVQDFIFGGMENTSATTQTDLTLHDERTHLDYTSDPLVAHELAHQWFGNLLTCRDWSHGWLNEGFATFMERVWVECKSGPDGGFEEAKYYSYQDWKEYLDDDQHKYRRPIVFNTYIEPIDLFDTHLYQKGGLVLNLIRSILGEADFWKSVQLYLVRHHGQTVETLDLIRAIEEATGKNLRRVFDEWVFNAGYPEFEVSYQWHEDKKLTEWVIEQKQTGGQPSVTKDGVTTSLFHLPLSIEMTLENGERIKNTIDVGDARERVFLPSPSRPVMVRFDRDFTIPKTLKFPRPKEMLLYQLTKDSDCMGRIEAAQELGREIGKTADSELINVLEKVLTADAFWGVQVEAARVLSSIRTDQARDALVRALKISNNPKGRRGIVSALGAFKDEPSAAALKTFAEGDPSYFVEADATYAWASSKMKPWDNHRLTDIKSVEDFLHQQLEKNSYRQVIRAATLRALSELPGVESGDRPKALETLIEWTKRGHDTDARGAAVRALGSILKSAKPNEKVKILDVLSYLAEEDNFRLRFQLVPALEDSECEEAIPILSRIAQKENDGRITRAVQRAINHLMTSGTLPESVLNLKTALEKLEEEHRKLRSLFEEKMGKGFNQLSE